MMSDTLHPNVAFATKFSDPTGDYLNAFTAIARVEGLIEDAERMGSCIEAAQIKFDAWLPWYGADIVSYYAVGLVTCLEWHARSRIADLANFSPSDLKSEDLKGQVSEKVMIQLLTQGASVASLISAATSVGTFAKYMDVFNRVLKALKATRNAYDFLQDTDPNTGQPWLTSDDLEELQRLFVFRHELVHEVGRDVVGHLNFRQAWTHEEAVSSGQRVLRLIHALETAITTHAPEDFPNKLDTKFWPIWRLERLDNEIRKLETKVLKIIEAVEAGPYDHTKEDWLAALEASRSHLDLERSFIQTASFLHAKHIDLTSPLQEQIAQARHDYLQMLIKYADLHLGLPEGLDDVLEEAGV